IVSAAGSGAPACGAGGVAFAALVFLGLVDLAQLGKFLVARRIGGGGARSGGFFRFRFLFGRGLDDDLGLVRRGGGFARRGLRLLQGAGARLALGVGQAQVLLGPFLGLTGGFCRGAALFLYLIGDWLRTPAHGDVLARRRP